MIEVDNITVRFGGITALQDVDLTLERGEILSVIGPNGSGKSTLFNAICGYVTPTDGSVRVDGDDAGGLSPHRRVRLGIGRTFQTPRMDFEVDVRNTVLCGFLPTVGTSLLGSMLRTPRIRADERRISAEVDRLLERFGLQGLAGAPLGELPMGLVRIVDVARAMAMQPGYLLLDEPAAGLTPDEQAVLVGEIERLAAENVGVLVVEHNFDLVRDVSHRITALNRGQVIAKGSAEEVATDPAVLDAYLGVADDEIAEAPA